jgi:DNA mismatch repair protein MutL
MNPRIQKLDDQLSNQIAAGEVVERPGSALKELVENSLDAGAKNIRVYLREGGASLLEVADDGHGIHGQDLLLALDRHATSKIRRTEDLFAIESWGFRGEALASIAAVSRLTLSSRTAEESVGREIVCEGGVIREDRPVARPVGTTVRVEDLFFNTPARKKFQKSTGAESTFCSQTFHRLSLSAPECSFELHANGERLFHYAATEKMESRVADVYRSSWRLNLDENEIMKVEAESGSSPMKLKAWILPSKHFIPSSRGILLYVNRRAVKDKLLQQSVLTAAKEALFGNLYPQLVLMLETAADGVDVNVHPSKSEVRFRDSGHVFAFVRKHLEKALAGDRRGSVSLDMPALAPSPEMAAPTLFASSAQFHQKAAEPKFEAGWLVQDAAPPLSPAAAPPAYSGPQGLGTGEKT